ncbi:MAG: hypothetical protein KF832_19540 [Caldilineaceae bacterium]|nr:hypothetical protein [Caldilineaceae bacterium]
MDNQQSHTDFPRTIGRPARSALAAAGYTHLEHLTTISEKELLKLHGMGPKALGILRQTLAEMGLAFAPNPDKKSSKK